VTTAAASTVDSVATHAADAAFGTVLRDIARGGITGLIVGLIGLGIGGRVVMRLAALLVPESAGAFTENGNRIGDITLAGSLGLALLGVFLGAGVATIWVVISPWIPGVGLRRALLAMPIAVGLGAFALIDGGNRDFFILRRDPAVVGVLIVLIAVIGLMFALVDDALDGRLPPATGAALRVYGLLSFVGLGVALLVITGFLTAPETVTVLMGIALFGVGVATLGTWIRRVRGQPAPTWAEILGRVALVAAIILGCVRTLPELTQTLGMA